MNFFKDLKNKYVKWQSCPSNEDLNLKEINEISKYLTGKDDTETITNILEWQDRNMDYWFEKADLLRSIWGSFCLVILLFMPSLNPWGIIPDGIFFRASILFLIPSFILLCLTYFEVIDLITLFFICGAFMLLWACFEPITYSFLGSCLLFSGIIFGGLLLFLSYIWIKYPHQLKKGTEYTKEDLLRLLKLTFKLKLSLRDILKYKWVICGDYAKLGSTMLLKSFQKKDVCLIGFDKHIASAICIDNKLYVLDQKLPLIRADAWLEKFKKKSADVYKIRAEKSEITFEYLGKFSEKICSKETPILNENIFGKAKIISDLEKSLKIEFSGEKSNPVEINDFPKNLAKYYDENTHLSIIRLIRNRIDSELGMNIERITNIDLELDNDDIKLKIYLK
uniref:Transglutaminase-like domain-containing protein n=1 Tax=Methanococcus maripaludis (strain C6 / ATCC BAA-1332) TaxID=444158 RepID=A9A7C3_METM6